MKIYVCSLSLTKTKIPLISELDLNCCKVFFKVCFKTKLTSLKCYTCLKTLIWSMLKSQHIKHKKVIHFAANSPNHDIFIGKFYPAYFV